MLESLGYQVLPGIYSTGEIERLAVGGGTFAIRRFLLSHPLLLSVVFTPRLLDIIRTYMGPDYFLVKSIYFDKPPGANWFVAAPEVCAVPAGGVMLMRPLLVHASSRTADVRPRRVIHLEFCNRPLPAGLRWAEELAVF